jgi:hypothetical protein
MLRMKIFVISLLCFVGSSAIPQQAETQLTEDQIKKALEEVIDDDYVRIPKKDFDVIIENRISNIVGAKINTIIGITVATIGLLSALSFFQNLKSRSSLKEEIDSKFSGLKNEITADLREFVNDYSKASIDPRFEFFEKLIALETKNVKSESETLLVQIQEAHSKAKEEQARTRRFIMEGEAQELINIVKNKTNKPEDIATGERLLKEFMEIHPNSPTINTVIDILSYMYYDQKSYKEVNELLSKYGDRNLSATVYINGALTAIFDYHQYATPEKKSIALDYLDKALHITQGYGEALGLKLEIFMMDYFRTEKEEIKKEAAIQAEAVLDSILNSASDIPAYETVSRLSRDFRLESYKKLITNLHELFKDKIETMLLRANNYNDQRGRERFKLSDISSAANAV